MFHWKNGYFANFVVSVISGAIAAFLARFEMSSVNTWERRERAYEEIINALYNVLQYCVVQKEDYGQGTGLSADRESEL